MAELAVSEDFTINYAEAGDPESPAVVLVHGFTSDLRMWAPLMEPLARDYRPIAVDLRGHGRTTAPEDLASYTMAAFSDDLAALLDGLEIDVCAVIGCSFGGMIAAHFAVEHPERLAGLVLSDASAAYENDAYDERYRARETAMLAQESVVERFGTAELGKRAAASVSDTFLAEGLRKRYARMSREGYLGSARVRRERPDLLPRLGERLQMPVMVCTGTDDPVNSASLVMAAEIPGARVATFRNTGHGIPALRPEAFADTVLEFFADIEEGAALGGTRTV